MKENALMILGIVLLGGGVIIGCCVWLLMSIGTGINEKENSDYEDPGER